VLVLRDRVAAFGECAQDLFRIALIHLASIALEASLKDTTISLLELLDIVLLANLILIVIFSGYENFVSKIAVAQDA
jgi:uncharacterized protein (TIGR00645 family)